MTERPIIFSAPMVRAILDGRKTQTRRVMKPQMEVREIAGTFGGGVLAYPRPKSEGGGAWIWPNAQAQVLASCPYGVPGDRLWVKETFTYFEQPDQDTDVRRNESHRPQDGKRYERWMNRVMAQPLPGEDFLVYLADQQKRSLAEWPYPHPIYDHCVGKFGKTTSPIYMPRWASRITLEITDVRVQQLQSISEDDAKAEGLYEFTDPPRVPTSSYGSSPADCWETDPRKAYARLWDAINAKRGFGWEPNPWVWALSFRRIEVPRG